MDIGKKARWVVFAAAVPISLYVSIFGTIMMGFCPGIQCWPHTFAWTLLAPCLLLAILSLRATAIAAVLLLIAHIWVEFQFYGTNLSSLWDTDKALEKCFWSAVFLLVVSAVLPQKISD